MIRIKEDRYGDRTILEVRGEFTPEQAAQVVGAVKALGLPLHMTLTQTSEALS